jgi:hypothetical protein
VQSRMSLLAAVAFAFCVTAGFAAAPSEAVLGADAPASPLKVIRHMAFDLAFDSQSTIQTKVSGIGIGLSSGLVTDDGPLARRRSTISVDVVAATADGGLAVDISEDRSAPFRVGILGDDLMIGSDVAVTEEEQALLPYLARGFVRAETVAVGAKWTASSYGGGISARTTYTITSVDEDGHTVGLAIAGSSSAEGVKAFDATTTGSATYDIGKVVPLKLDLTTRTVVSRGERLATVIAHIAATLREDTFHKTENRV